MTTTTMSSMFQTTATQQAAYPGGVSGVPRMVLRLEGLAALALSVAAYAHLGGSWSLFALLFLAPDLSFFGYLAGPRVGAAAYNAMHSYVGPAILAGIGLTLAPAWLPVALIWSGHVGFDRMAGYGLKYGTAFGHTHLGRVGK